MGKNIIVVDDNRLVLKFLEKTLVKEGHNVRLAQDGFVALDMIDEFKPDIMFIDMFMPNIPALQHLGMASQAVLLTNLGQLKLTNPLVFSIAP